ncbi:MAG TPA: CDP-alcohol phosphatidyltransferase family protein [Vicinamibacterales bacterium]|nr:CDP-alcohol phosphatidyltransferase family protein [Vicinamibacterales bacterium]
MTFTGAVGAAFNYPLQAIIATCIRLRIHPNLLTFTGVLVSVAAGLALSRGHFLTAGGVMVAASVFDYIDGKVAHQGGSDSKFGGFWDSVIDRFSDLALSVGLIVLYAKLGSTDYVLITSIAMVFATMTSYSRARAECFLKQCKVGFMERPERIVLFMLGAFTNRMAAVLWVIGVLSIVTVANRVYYTYVELEGKTHPKPTGVLGMLWRGVYWTDDRATFPYDAWVFSILAFILLTPPDWLGDPMARGEPGLIGWIQSMMR